MRAAILLVGLVVADEKGAPAFDPKSGANTLKWMRAELLKSRDFPRGNELAGRAADKKYRAALDGIKGKKIAWWVKVLKVTAEGGVYVSTGLAWENKADKRSYSITLVNGADVKAGVSDHFSAKGKPFLAKLKFDDDLLLTGTVEDVAPRTELSPEDPAQKFASYNWRVCLKDYALEP